MSESSAAQFVTPEDVEDPLTEVLRDGARRLIQQAVEAEFAELLEQHADERDERGRAAVVRNGHLPEREVLSGIGPVAVRVPKARSRGEEAVVFHSKLVPPYVRRARSLDAALPWLYLKGVSTGEMGEALEVLVGPDAKGLSASVISRLKTQWREEYEAWCARGLERERWVYWWADGIYSGLRAEGLREATRRAAERGSHKLKTRPSRGEKRQRKRMATVAAVYRVAAHRIPTRKVLEVVLWILNTGAQWHMLPQCYPNYKTVRGADQERSVVLDQPIRDWRRVPQKVRKTEAHPRPCWRKYAISRS